jgi:hypothetical protein
VPSDIADRLESAARRHVEAALPADPSGELAAMDFAALLTTYGNWRGRFVPQRSRTLQISRELQAELAAGPEWQTAEEMVLDEIRVGEDLTPRLGKNVDIAYVPRAQRKTGGGLDLDLDAVLAHNGLHHLHLGPDEGARFVGRTKDCSSSPSGKRTLTSSVSTRTARGHVASYWSASCATGRKLSC